jgi:glycosyltransferase involved in cell wall biosynthesis
MSGENYILWLPSWYPNKLEPYNGDFIQRHAIAASRYRKIIVVHVKRDEEGIVTTAIKREETTTGNLTEIIIYYYQGKFSVAVADRLFSYLKFKRLYNQEIIALKSRIGLPELTHVHVALNAGMVALWVKKKFGVPYIISEHWTIYLPGAVPGIKSLGFMKSRVKKIFRDATRVVVVSKYLGEKIKGLFKISSYEVVPNVVNEEIFQVGDKKNELPSFIHISGLNYQKNPEDLLQAFKIIQDDGFSFNLKIIGPESLDLHELSFRMGLEDKVNFLNEMPQKQLATHLQQSDALLLYSRYETFGCVLIEAFACGVPVIVSDLEVFHENVIENTNGIFAKPGDPKALADKIKWFMNHQESFIADTISESALNRYSYNIVGKTIDQLYTSTIEKN